jgi:hypothetical protein
MAPAGRVEITHFYASGADVSEEDGEGEQADSDTAAEEPEEEKVKGIADLLVQEKNTWGALPQGSDEIG